MNKLLFDDKWKGMLLLSAYGDALGALHEMAALSGDGAVRHPQKHLHLPMGNEFSPDRFEDPWAIWTAQTPLNTRRGITTDDTAFRLGLLHPWLSQLQIPIAKTIMQEGFGSFFSSLPNQELPHSSSTASRVKQFVDWQAMYQAANTVSPQACLFYHPNLPTSFGLFQCLDIAAFFADYSTEEVFLRFKTLNPLDQAYGKLITGLCAVLIAKGISRSIHQENFSKQFPPVLEETLQEIEPFISLAEREDWALILTMTKKARTFAKLPHQTDYQFLENFRTKIFLDQTAPHFHEGIRNNHDPLLFWMQLLATLEYSQFQALPTLRLLASGAGDADTLAALAGLIFGAWLGLNELQQVEDEDIQLAQELTTVADTLSFMFGEGFHNFPNPFSEGNGFV